MENIKLILQLFVRPSFAMSETIDRASWFVALLLMFAASIAFFFSVDTRLAVAYPEPIPMDYGYSEFDDDQTAATLERLRISIENANSDRPRIPLVGDRFFSFFSFGANGIFQPIVTISIFYIPLLIIVISLFGRRGSFGTLLQRDYGALSTCAMTAWTAAHLPAALIGVVFWRLDLPGPAFLGLWIGAAILFGFFMVFALRTVSGVDYPVAIVAVLLGPAAFVVGMFISTYLSPWLFSPFILFYAVLYFGGFLRGEVRGFGNSFRQRQNFKRFLQNATINPRDADAHLQLGLIYLQRRQDTKALEHLTKAVDIDPTEVDANYELGKYWRRHRDFSKAIEHFTIVASENENHSLGELWREIGATYLEAGMPAQALPPLERFVDRRGFDPEGLYLFGMTLKELGETAAAADAFGRVIEATETSPDFRRGDIQQWGKLARKQL